MAARGADLRGPARRRLAQHVGQVGPGARSRPGRFPAVQGQPALDQPDGAARALAFRGDAGRGPRRRRSPAERTPGSTSRQRPAARPRSQPSSPCRVGALSTRQAGDQRRLSLVGARHRDPPETAGRGGGDGGQHPADRAQLAVEPEFAQERHPVDGRRRDGARQR